MRAVVQRVSRAEVRVQGESIGRIGRGLVALIGIEHADDETDAAYLVEKIVGLRIFPDATGNMNLALSDLGGALLLVSQFTLHGDCRKGRRPSFVGSMSPGPAEALYNRLVTLAKGSGIPVETGRFRAMMEIELVNDGPVTLLLDSKRLF
jgi:D-tyrosyl-tRNA(Tyr) deacylase